MILDWSFTQLSDYVDAVKSFFANLYNWLTFAFNLLPPPFNAIALSFVAIIIAIAVVKVIRG